MVNLENHGHDGLPFEGDTPATRARYFGDQFVDVKELQESGDRCTEARQSCLVFDLGKELAKDVPVTKAHDGVFSSHDGAKEIYVLSGSGIEPSIGPPIVGYGIGQFLEVLLRSGGVAHRREGLQVTAVGCMADLGIAVKVGYSLGHGKPADHLLALPPTLTPDLELIGMIDHGLNTQYAPVFVVHLYPVFLHPMFDPCARPSLLVLVEDFTLKAPVKFSTEEGQDILGTEAKGGMLQ